MDWMNILKTAVEVIGVASVAALALSKLTKATWDDKLAGFLGKAKKALDILALNPKK